VIRLNQVIIVAVIEVVVVVYATFPPFQSCSATKCTTINRPLTPPSYLLLSYLAVWRPTVSLLLLPTLLPSSRLLRW
jgi:hypothetical protein